MRKSLHIRVLTRYLGLALLATALPGCALLIPENPSAPRYNDVLGGPRKPMLNPGGSDASAGPRAQNNFPPVDAATKSRASDIMANDVPPPMMAAPVTPVAASNVSPASAARQVPVENAPLTMASSGYPDLRSVPPAPSKDTDDRMNRVRQQLESERDAAAGAAAKLNSDANAEPSLIPDPVEAAPLPPARIPSANPAPVLPPQSSIQPQATEAPGYIALPPPMPSASNSGNSQTAFAIPVATPAPIGAPAAMEPIVLRAPSAASAAPQPAPVFGYGTPAPAVNAASMPASSSGFNPMDGAAPITLRAPTAYASGTSYLPPSRYATRRQ